MAPKATIDPTAIADTVDAVKAQPELAHVTFRVASAWTGALSGEAATGALTQAGRDDDSRAGSFRFRSDEPVALLGEDTAASPGEYALQALASCYTVTCAANAAVRGITMDSLEIELEGDFDLHGFFGLGDVRPGMQELRVTMRIESPDASREELEDLVRTVEQRSPLRDTFANPVVVSTRLGD